MSAKIRFSKMHGIGNDFVIMDGIRQRIFLEALQSSIPQLADRHFGIGFDQLIIMEPSANADFFCRIFNADGSEAEQCGNGLRCVARFAYDSELTPQHSFTLETKAGIYAIEFEDDDHIQMTMGVPTIVKNAITLKLEPERDRSITLSILSIGNPHAIVNVPLTSNELAAELGPKISSHVDFPNGINVGFMQVLTPHHIRLRTFERGTGLTHACGSNACAAAVTGIMNGWLTHHVQVEYSHGSLFVKWKGENHAIYLTGPTANVFEGEINLQV